MYIFGCSNCKDALDHAVATKINPSTNNLYTFCKECETAHNFVRENRGIKWQS
jgi:hypothetical protein